MAVCSAAVNLDGTDCVGIPAGGLEIVTEGGSHVEALPAAGLGVYLKLQGVVVELAGGGGLVVDDGQGGGRAVLVVHDDVDSTGDDHGVEVQLEGSRPTGFEPVLPP